MFGHAAHGARSVGGSRYAGGEGKAKLPPVVDLCEDKAKDVAETLLFMIAGLSQTWAGSSGLALLFHPRG
jgi:hypothetical protein